MEIIHVNLLFESGQRILKKQFWQKLCCPKFLPEEKIKFKYHHKKILFNNFHVNGHTLGFPSQAQNLEAPCTA